MPGSFYNLSSVSECRYLFTLLDTPRHPSRSCVPFKNAFHAVIKDSQAHTGQRKKSLFHRLPVPSKMFCLFGFNVIVNSEILRIQVTESINSIAWLQPGKAEYTPTHMLLHPHWFHGKTEKNITHRLNALTHSESQHLHWHHLTEKRMSVKMDGEEAGQNRYAELSLMQRKFWTIELHRK